MIFMSAAALVAIGHNSVSAKGVRSLSTGDRALLQGNERKIRNGMKDPDAATFVREHLYWDDVSNGLLGDQARADGKFPHVCGYVNGKNAFGAYVGLRRFNGTWVDDPSDEGEVRQTFEKAWKESPCSSDELEE
jgi:hypothetical protein